MNPKQQNTHWMKLINRNENEPYIDWRIEHVTFFFFFENLHIHSIELVKLYSLTLFYGININLDKVIAVFVYLKLCTVLTIRLIKSEVYPPSEICNLKEIKENDEITQHVSHIVYYKVKSMTFWSLTLMI